MLQIEHVGRKSGLSRKTVLEVVEHADGNPVIASVFGEQSAWLLNITANADVRVKVDVVASLQRYGWYVDRRSLGVDVKWGRQSFDAVAQSVK